MSASSSSCFAIRALLEGEIRAVEGWVFDGGDVNQRCKRPANEYGVSGGEGGTLLIIAAMTGNDELVRWLLERGASVDLAGSRRFETPLMATVDMHVCNKDVLLTLLKAGANVNARSRAGASALHFAAQNGDDLRECAFELLKAGADARAVDDTGRTAYEVAMSGHHYLLASTIQSFTDRMAWGVPPKEFGTSNCAAKCIVTYIDDGECDPPCNVPECQYDGDDCRHAPSWIGRIPQPGPAIVASLLVLGAAWLWRFQWHQPGRARAKRRYRKREPGSKQSEPGTEPSPTETQGLCPICREPIDSIVRVVRT
eukprot:jgi/Chrpa1/25071/Chrysochromulina_OHIO_Genome00002876-RA